MDRLWEWCPIHGFGMCKNGWSGPEYNHLDREQHDKLEDSVDIKPGGTVLGTVDIKRRIFQETHYRNYCL